MSAFTDFFNQLGNDISNNVPQITNTAVSAVSTTVPQLTDTATTAVSNVANQAISAITNTATDASNQFVYQTNYGLTTALPQNLITGGQYVNNNIATPAISAISTTGQTVGNGITSTFSNDNITQFGDGFLQGFLNPIGAIQNIINPSNTNSSASGTTNSQTNNGQLVAVGSICLIGLIVLKKIF